MPPCSFYRIPPPLQARLERALVAISLLGEPVVRRRRGWRRGLSCRLAPVVFRILPGSADNRAAHSSNHRAGEDASSAAEKRTEPRAHKRPHKPSLGRASGHAFTPFRSLPGRWRGRGRLVALPLVRRVQRVEARLGFSPLVALVLVLFELLHRLSTVGVHYRLLGQRKPRGHETQQRAGYRSYSGSHSFLPLFDITPIVNYSEYFQIATPAPPFFAFPARWH